MPKVIKQRNPAAQQNTRPDESNHKSRNWICTLNNWTEVEHAKLVAYFDDKAKYAVIGKEVGKTGVPHLQIYFQMKTPYSGQTIKNHTSKRMWMGIANSPTKSRDYCTKDGDFIELGTFDAGRDSQGKAGGAKTKQTWKDLWSDIQSGMTFEDCCSKYPSMVMQTRNAVMAECLRHAPVRDFKSCVHVYFGHSGTGKTERAKQEAGKNAYVQTPSRKNWFDGYDGRKNVVVDEMRKGQFSLGSLLTMMDKYDSAVEVKGGMVNFAPKYFAITSNHSPDEWYSADVLDEESRKALWRRINVCKMVTKSGNTSKFEDYCPPNMEMWHGGCICNQNVVEPAKLTLNSLGRQKAVLDLSNSSFLDEPLSQTSTSLLLPKKKKAQSSPPSKQVGVLTKELDDLYGPADPIPEDPFEVVTISDSDDEDSNEDPIDSFDSDDPNNMDEDEEISESLE